MSEGLLHISPPYISTEEDLEFIVRTIPDVLDGMEKLVYYVLFPALLFRSLVLARIDFGATVMTYAAVRVSGKPADEEHPRLHAPASWSTRSAQWSAECSAWTSSRRAGPAPPW